MPSLDFRDLYNSHRYADVLVLIRAAAACVDTQQAQDAQDAADEGISVPGHAAVLGAVSPVWNVGDWRAKSNAAARLLYSTPIQPMRD